MIEGEGHLQQAIDLLIAESVKLLGDPGPHLQRTIVRVTRLLKTAHGLKNQIDAEATRISPEEGEHARGIGRAFGPDFDCGADDDGMRPMRGYAMPNPYMHGDQNYETEAALAKAGVDGAGQRLAEALTRNAELDELIKLTDLRDRSVAQGVLAPAWIGQRISELSPEPTPEPTSETQGG